MSNLRRDGLEVVFMGNRSGGAGLFTWISNRASVFASWPEPAIVTAVNTAAL